MNRLTSNITINLCIHVTVHTHTHTYSTLHDINWGARDAWWTMIDAVLPPPLPPSPPLPPLAPIIITFPTVQVENVVLVDLDHNSVTDDKLDTKLPRLPSEAVQTFKAR
jgi:hypothetical protein